jgi:hypothetical protein
MELTFAIWAALQKWKEKKYFVHNHIGEVNVFAFVI